MVGLTMVLAMLLGASAVAAPDAPLKPTRVVASSALAPSDGRTFGAENLFDGDPATMWRPDARGALGLGQFVRIDLGAEMDVTAIEVLNGNQRPDRGKDRYCADARAQALWIHADSGGHRSDLGGDERERWR